MRPAMADLLACTARIDDACCNNISEGSRRVTIYVNRKTRSARSSAASPWRAKVLSGTGQKQGGPNYLPRFSAPDLKVVE